MESDMTDETRELLERAAKAAGLRFEEINAKLDGEDRFCGLMVDPGYWPRGWFDPLNNLNDALRLAVDLGLIVHANHGDKESVCYDNTSTGYSELWANHPDKYRATCTAITRAAAEIGRRMQ